MTDSHIQDPERAAALLDAHPGDRVFRALPPLDTLQLAFPGGKVRTAVVLDVETTGLNRRWKRKGRRRRARGGAWMTGEQSRRFNPVTIRIAWFRRHREPLS